MNKHDKQKQEEALLAIALWRESNLSQGAFCRREGISRSTFQHWRRRYDESYEFRVKKSNSPTTKPKESFLSVSIDSPKPQELYDLEVIYETGVRIKCSSSISTTELQKLILGRKNYLFAGSDKAAQNIAMMYSFFASCKVNEVEPLTWLTYVLENILEHKANKLYELLPNNYKA